MAEIKNDNINKVQSLDSMFEEFDKETKIQQQYSSNKDIYNLIKKLQFYDNEKQIGNTFKSVETQVLSQVLDILAKKYIDVISFHPSDAFEKFRFEHGLKSGEKINFLSFADFSGVFVNIHYLDNSEVSKSTYCRYISEGGDITSHFTSVNNKRYFNALNLFLELRAKIIDLILNTISDCNPSIRIDHISSTSNKGIRYVVRLRLNFKKENPYILTNTLDNVIQKNIVGVTVEESNSNGWIFAQSKTYSYQEEIDPEEFFDMIII